MRITFKDHRRQVAKELQAMHRKKLIKVGEEVVTEAKKMCPVKTGRLRNSIRKRVYKDKVVIGTNVQYSIYVHEGTKKMRARPFLKSAMYKVME